MKKIMSLLVFMMMTVAINSGCTSCSDEPDDTMDPINVATLSTAQLAGTHWEFDTFNGWFLRSNPDVCNQLKFSSMPVLYNFNFSSDGTKCDAISVCKETYGLPDRLGCKVDIYPYGSFKIVELTPTDPTATKIRFEVHEYNSSTKILKAVMYNLVYLLKKTN